MSKIDEAEYQLGRAFAEAGNTLRSAVEHIWSLPEIDDDNKTVSFALGFADGLLDELREIKGSS